jgi:hypothetical protein
VVGCGAGVPAAGVFAPESEAVAPFTAEDFGTVEDVDDESLVSLVSNDSSLFGVSTSALMIFRRLLGDTVQEKMRLGFPLVPFRRSTAVDDFLEEGAITAMDGGRVASRRVQRARRGGTGPMLEDRM